MTSLLPRHQCHTALEHMTRDTQLFERSHLCCEYYIWPQPSLTYSYAQSPADLPADETPRDSAQRYTGGGIVYHCPGDIVLCCILDYHTPGLPRRLRDKITGVQTHIQTVLAYHNRHLLTKTPQTSRDITFCQTYHSPYELYYNQDKAVALSLRTDRKLIMIQGIIHCQSTQVFFPLAPVATQGLHPEALSTLLADLNRYDPV